MRPSRFTMLFLSLLFLFAVSGFAQTPADSAIARATVANAQAGLAATLDLST